MKISVVHFQPIEKYPPVMNLINYWKEEHGQIEYIVLTSEGNSKSKNIDQSGIYRLINLAKRSNRIFRMFRYFLFHLKTCLFLIRFRPDAVIYFETLSSAGVWWYKNIFNSSVRVFIHYHEYTSPAELQNGMAVNRWFHNIERKNYSKAEHISHTNWERMEMFLKDEKLQKTSAFSILPNYPPKVWKEIAKGGNRTTVSPTRFVYVGAVSDETMFLSEIIEFFSSQKSLTLDIYTNNITQESRELLASKNVNTISLKGSLDYFELPAILKNYDVGLIIYRGTSENYIYNAPNKLFEYLACGLDVWVSKEMKGVVPYYRVSNRPFVIPVDYSDKNNMLKALDTGSEGVDDLQEEFFCESVLKPLTKKLTDGFFPQAHATSEFQRETTTRKNSL